MSTIGGARARWSAVAFAAMALGGIALAPSASAAAPAVQITSPTSNQTLKDSTPTIQGSAEMSRGVINDLSVTISSEGGHPVPPVYRVAGEDRASVPFSWTPTLTFNGQYQVQARASGSDRPVDTNGEESGTSTRSFAIEAAPSTPKGVKATVDESSRFVTVKWSANPEPDMIGYQIQRAVGDSTDWAVAGEANGTTFEDKRTADGNGGTYRYRIVAVREGATSGSGVTSNPSAAAEATVPAPPPTTTAVQNPGGGGGSGGSGGSDGGSSTPSSTSSTVAGDAPDPDGTSSGSGSTATTSKPTSSGPVISKAGKVDLSGFSLLDQTKAPTPKSTPAPDSGFSESLPFGAQADGSAVGEDGEALGAGQMPLTADDGSDRRVMLSFLAAGLLATVLLMHVLWIKGEVDRPVLEPLPPQGPREPGRLKANRG